MQNLRITILLFLIGGLFSLNLLLAQEVPQVLADIERTYLAKVISVEEGELKTVPNTNTEALYQNVTVKFLKGNKSGTQVSISDSSFPLEVGDKVYVRYIQTSDGAEYYSISEPYRLPQLFFLLVAFIVAVLIFGGKQGFLALLALFISFGVIFKILFPQILGGTNIIFTATTRALL